MAHWLCCEPTPRKVRFIISGYVEIDDVSDDAALEYVENSYGPKDLIENAAHVTIDLECWEDA